MIALKQNDQRSTFDPLKWVLVFILLAAGVFANHYFAAQLLALRLLVGLVLLGVVVLIALQTASGRKALSFTREARIEMRKVVWPTRQETTQTTTVVVIMVIVMALLLWGVDSALLWAISMLTGQRG